MKVLQKISGRALYVDTEGIWLAQGCTFFKVDILGNRISKEYIIGTMFERILGKSRLVRQFFRVGIHHIIPLSNKNILVTLRKRLLIITPEGEVLKSFSGYRGNKPAYLGICVTPKGSIFLGEYTLNLERKHDTTLYRSTDNGASFEPILRFEKNEICHIHFIQWDKVENCLWLGTGDKNHECKIMRSQDDGLTWTIVGGGNQLWRAVSVCFLKDVVIWGTDAGHVMAQNYIIRMNRKSREIEKVKKIPGPCHSSGMLSDDTIFLCTGVEDGPNEADRFARLFELNNLTVSEILKIEKDIFPLIIQYGVIRFPIGMESTKRLVFSTYGLKNNGENVIVADSTT